MCVFYIYSVCVYIHISSPAFGVGGEDCDTGGLYENVVQEGSVYIPPCAVCGLLRKLYVECVIFLLYQSVHGCMSYCLIKHP